MRSIRMLQTLLRIFEEMIIFEPCANGHTAADAYVAHFQFKLVFFGP